MLGVMAGGRAGRVGRGVGVGYGGRARVVMGRGELHRQGGSSLPSPPPVCCRVPAWPH